MSTQYKKGKPTKLTTNFKSTEFDCKGNGCCSTTIIEHDFIKMLQHFRNYLNVRIGPNVTITVNSGYRCEKHNSEIGGSITSKHCWGKAADIIVKKSGTVLDAKRICCLAQDFGFNGIEYIDSGALHVDNRTGKWHTRQVSRKYYDVSDFYKWSGLKREKIPFNYSETVAKGSVNESVCYVKYALYSLGYFSESNAPDVKNKACGNGTVKAIKAFQKAYGLKVDGKFGPACHKKLKEIW